MTNTEREDYFHEFNFFKDLYMKEVSRKESLDNNYPVVIVTVLSGLTILSYIFIEKYQQLRIEPSAQNLPAFILIVGLICYIICVYWLALAFNNGFKGYKYTELPLLTHVNTNKENYIVQEYNKLLRKEVLEVASEFQRINQIRLDCYHKSRKSLVLTFAMTAIYISIFYLIQLL